MLTARNQRDDRLGLREATQVLEVAVLPVNVLDVAIADGNRGRRQDGDAVGDHLRHQRLAPTGIFGLRNMAHGQDPGVSVQRWLGRGRSGFGQLGVQQQRGDAQVLHDFHVVALTVLGLFEGVLNLGNGHQVL